MSLPQWREMPEDLPVLATTDKLNMLWQEDIKPLKERLNTNYDILQERIVDAEGLNIPGHEIIDLDDNQFGREKYLRFVNCRVTDDAENDATIVEYVGRIAIDPPNIQDYVYTGNLIEQFIIRDSLDLENTNLGEYAYVDKPVINKNIIAYEGDYKATLPGQYHLSLSFKDPYNYKWSDDGTHDTKEFDWEILGQPIVVQVPSQRGSLTYTGTSQSPQWNNIDIDNIEENEDVAAEGTFSATQSGSYTVTFSLKRTNVCVWPDNTNEPKTVTWTIGDAVVNVPTVTSNLVFNGSAQSPTISSYNSDLISVLGNLQTNAGSYQVKFSLKNKTNYKWSDGTITDKYVNWSIAKASSSVIPDESYIELANFRNTASVLLRVVGDGTLSVSSSNPTAVTATLNGRTVNIVGKQRGSAVIALRLSETSNYYATNNVISVTSEARIVVDLPTVTNTTLKYNGQTQGPTIYASNLVIIEPDTGQNARTPAVSAIRAGQYQLVARLKDDSMYCWPDGFWGEKHYPWQIDKAGTAYITASFYSKKIKLNTTYTITYTVYGGGDLYFDNDTMFNTTCSYFTSTNSTKIGSGRIIRNFKAFSPVTFNVTFKLTEWWDSSYGNKYEMFTPIELRDIDVWNWNVVQPGQPVSQIHAGASWVQPWITLTK